MSAAVSAPTYGTKRQIPEWSEFGHMLIPEPLELSLDLWFSAGADPVPQH